MTHHRSVIASLGSGVAMWAAIGVARSASADTTLFDNGVFVTGAGTGVNAGFQVSQAESSVVSIGFNANATTAQGGPIRVTDDFVVSGAPAGGVRLSHMHFYGVQTNTVTSDVHFGAFYVAIHDGPPFAGGNLIAGDFTTNRLLSSTFSGVYRLSMSGAPATNRPVTRLDVDMTWAPRLANGTYWMTVSAVGDSSIATTPNPQTIFVTPHPATANAQQYFNSTWFAIWDLPFTLFALCPADFNASHAVSVQDIFDFLAAWFVNDPRADFNGAGGVSVQDIFDFLGAWFAACA